MRYRSIGWVQTLVVPFLMHPIRAACPLYDSGFVVPARRRHLRLKAEPADDLLERAVLALRCSDCGADFNAISALDVAAIQFMEKQAAAGHGLQQ